MKLEMVGLSDVGKTRKNNEDSFGIFNESNLCLVCDGMGGHNGGSVASQLAVKIICLVFQNEDGHLFEPFVQDVASQYRSKAGRMIAGLRLANRLIYATASRKSELKGMGTTVAVLQIQDQQALLAHVGDSRIYRIRERIIEQLTVDHSWINELIQDKEINEDQARFFENKNVITRALGMAPRVKIDLKVESVEPGDIFLLCSDGLTNAVNDDLLQAITVNYQNDLHFATQQLISIAKQLDGADNITVLLAKVTGNNRSGKSFPSLATTINEESEKIAALENKFLKKQKFFHDEKRNPFVSLFSNKLLLILMLMVIFLFILVFILIR